MGIKISWLNQDGKDLDAVEIYRSANKITPSNPGTMIATLHPSITDYEDNTVKNKNIYHYCVVAKKGEERAFGTSQQAGYFSETGPGNNTVVRGDWDSGFMDQITPAQFISTADLIAKIPQLVPQSYNNPVSWIKMAFRGKVLFIPSTTIMITTWAALYSAGMMYGEDGYGVSPTGAPGNVNQKRIIEINGLQYLARCARLTEIGNDKYLTLPADTIGSELRSTYGRMLRATLELPDGAMRRLGSLTTAASFFTPHHANASQQIVVSPTSSIGNILVSSKNVTWNTGIVLELIMP